MNEITFENAFPFKCAHINVLEINCKRERIEGGGKEGGKKEGREGRRGGGKANKLNKFFILFKIEVQLF